VVFISSNSKLDHEIFKMRLLGPVSKPGVKKFVSRFYGMWRSISVYGKNVIILLNRMFSSKIQIMFVLRRSFSVSVN
jgi:hypothetical protein